MLYDKDIRLPLFDFLEDNYGDIRILEEKQMGRSRADIVMVGRDNNIYGVEIKSDADTLERLSLQQQCYDKTFDTVSIVVGKKFKDSIEECIPNYWGIYVVYEYAGNCKIERKRAAKVNKNIEANSLLQLLWKEEIIKLLRNAGIKGISGKNRRLLRQIVIDNFTLKEIRDYTRETIKSRQNWRD